VRVCRLLGFFAALVVMVSAGALSAQPAGAAGQVSTASGTTIGPVQISALGHPRLCWEAAGNGSAVTLKHCDRMLQGQQWSLTPDGVLMNGNGYCLEAVANAASTQAAYGVSVTFALPPGVAASTLRVTPASSPPGSSPPGPALPGSTPQP